MNRSPDMLPEQRFWAKVDVSPGLGPKGECWEWRGSINSSGYGTFCFQHKTCQAHRVAWFLQYGEWPKNNACHKCDNTLCVRVDHLFDGTQRENAQDSFDKGRCARSAWGINVAKVVCARGHEYSPENTKWNIRPSGRRHRRCATCERENTKAHKQYMRDILPFRLISEC